MKFSVVIPTFNRAHFIGKAIESVLNQTYTDFELIIVDDGSTDNTAEIVRSINDNRIRYFWKENAERGAARNFGILHAKGEWLFFLDSDDEMLPDHLDTLDKFIELNTDFNFFATKYRIKRNGHLTANVYPTVKQGIYDIDLLIKGNTFASMVCVKRANPQLKLNVEDRAYSILEDWMFLLENLQFHKIFVIDKVTLVLNDHDDRSMRSDNAVIIAKRLMANQWALENISLSEMQRKNITAYSFYFCAIHAAIDKNFKQAKDYIRMAMQEAGRKKEFTKFSWKLRIKKLIG